MALPAVLESATRARSATKTSREQWETYSTLGQKSQKNTFHYTRQSALTLFTVLSRNIVFYQFVLSLRKDLRIEG